MTASVIEKNAVERIHVERREYKGKPYIDIRAHADFGNGEGFVPTKKGVTLPPDRLGELIETLQSIQEGKA